MKWRGEHGSKRQESVKRRMRKRKMRRQFEGEERKIDRKKKK